MKIIRPRSFHEHVSYSLSFDYEHLPGAGFSFDCDKDGKVDESRLNPYALKNYRACLQGEVSGVEGVEYTRDANYDYVPVPGTGRTVMRKVKNMGVRELYHTYWEPAIGECNRCGEEVILDGFTCTCDRCGIDYNMSGQQLCSREFWGEECNESAADILRGGDPFDGDY
jgi:hypothetical protein